MQSYCCKIGGVHIRTLTLKVVQRHQGYKTLHTLLIVFGSVSVSHYNTVRPHSSLGYQSPIPQTVMTKLIEPGFVMPTHQELQ